MGKLLCTAPSLFTKEMLFTEVFTKVFVIAVVLLSTIRVTEVTKIVISSQMLQ